MDFAKGLVSEVCVDVFMLFLPVCLVIIRRPCEAKPIMAAVATNCPECRF